MHTKMVIPGSAPPMLGFDGSYHLWYYGDVVTTLDTNSISGKHVCAILCKSTPIKDWPNELKSSRFKVIYNCFWSG